MNLRKLRIRPGYLLALLFALLLLAATNGPAYLLTLSLARLVLVGYSSRLAVLLVRGHVRGPLEFVAALGGVLYLVGLAADAAGVKPVEGRDLVLLPKALGTAFMLLPFFLAQLPSRVRRFAGLEGC